MSRKSLVVALALVLALAAVAPTLAQQDAQAPMLSKNFAKKTAKRAKAIAKRARTVARRANRRAASAKNRATKARNEAAMAGEEARSANRQLADQRAVTATVAGSVETSNDAEFVALGGPRVRVKVPPSGLIEVWAQVTIDPEGAVSLYEDGKQMPGQDPNDLCEGPSGVLVSHGIGMELRLSTPTGPSFAGLCGAEGPPVPMLFSTTPGEHIYELRYADCGCDSDPAGFRDRTLTVAPRP